MSDISTKDVPIQADLTELKQQLEVEKLRLEMRFIRRNHYAQLFNTGALVGVGLLVFYFFQRPQLDQMEFNRVLAEKNQIATLVTNALNVESERHRLALLKGIGGMFVQNEFVETILRSEIVLADAKSQSPSEANTVVAAVSPSEQPSAPAPLPPPPPAANAPTEPAAPPVTTPANRPSYPALDRINEVRARIHQLEIQYSQARSDYEKRQVECHKIRGTLEELTYVEQTLARQMFDEERGSGSGRRPAGKGAVWSSLRSQRAKLQAEFSTLTATFDKTGCNFKPPEPPAQELSKLQEFLQYLMAQ